MLGKYITLLASLAASVALATPIAFDPPQDHHVTKRDDKMQPAMPGVNFPDPSVIKTGDNSWVAFSTGSKYEGKYIHVQVANATNGWSDWKLKPGFDALPNLPSWVDETTPHVWAPDVVRLANDKYVMYYSAAVKAHPAFHCIGAATADTVDGPYIDTSKSPIICPDPTTEGGAIDPAGYASNGKQWVAYKVDANSLGAGGSCLNLPLDPSTGKPSWDKVKHTPIMLQEVSAKDGMPLVNNKPQELLTNGQDDGPLIEAPSLTQMPDGTFVLFFSSNCFTTPLYDVSYATSPTIDGTYTKHGPLMLTNEDKGLVGPGGLDIVVNGTHAVFHAGPVGMREMYTTTISGGGNDWTASGYS